MADHTIHVCIPLSSFQVYYLYHFEERSAAAPDSLGVLGKEICKFLFWSLWLLCYFRSMLKISLMAVGLTEGPP